MNTKTNLQIPISLIVKKQAEKMAAKQGFSSLQELIRVFIANYTNGNVSFFFGNPLSSEKLLIYEKDLEETKKAIRNGKIKAHDTAKDAINHLSSL